MPGVSDATVSEAGPSPREKAELIKLWLPSHLGAAERDSLCLGGVIHSEKEFRFGQLHDTLYKLRKARRIRRGLIIFHWVQLTGEGTKTQTKSQGVMRTVEDLIDRAVQRYRAARAALLHLDPSGSWQELYHALNDRDNRGPGKEPKEVPTSDGQYLQSWIWLSTPNTTTGDPDQTTISPDEVNEDMRVEWAQCVTCTDRWEEEAILLQEEMRRVVWFLEWKSKDWVSKADVRAGAVTPEVRSGLSTYAHKQAFVFRSLATRFCQRWRSKLISLSLPYDWATKFLETQGSPLVEPNLGRRRPEHLELETLESSTTHTEPSATTRLAEPHTLDSAEKSSILTGPEASNDYAGTSNHTGTGHQAGTSNHQAGISNNNPETSNNPETGNNNPDTSDCIPKASSDSDESTDDSDVYSSESEYEPGGW